MVEMDRQPVGPGILHRSPSDAPAVEPDSEHTALAHAEMARMNDVAGPLDLEDLRRVLDGRAAPHFEDSPRATKTTRLALDHGPVDVRIRANSFTMQWRGQRGANRYFPRLAPALTADLMRRAGLVTVTTATVAWMPSATIPSEHEDITPPSYVVWFVPREGGLDLFIREAPAEGPPTSSGPIPAEGPYELPTPWSVPHTYRDFPRGLACPHCAATSERYRTAGPDALVCVACGRSFDRE